MGVAHLKIQMYLLIGTWITQVWIMARLLPGPAYYSVWVLLCVFTALSPTCASRALLVQPLGGKQSVHLPLSACNFENK